MFIATLIAKERLSSGDISVGEDVLRAAGIHPFGRSWIEAERACDILFSTGPAAARTALEALPGEIDVIVQGEASRRRKLLVADMDSTMIEVECIDELADYAGIKAEVAEITDRAMRGELVFEDALRARVALLQGLDAAAIDRCREERVRYTPGAGALVRTMKRQGAQTLLVSGGFALFAEPIGAALGFDRVVANRLVIEERKLTGEVAAPIVGAAAKRQALLDAAAGRGLDASDAMAVGDGANDVPMLEAAGLGIAYRAKPAAVEAAGATVRHNDLTALLYAQGYSSEEWEAD